MDDWAQIYPKLVDGAAFLTVAIEFYILWEKHRRAFYVFSFVTFASCAIFVHSHLFSPDALRNFLSTVGQTPSPPSSLQQSSVTGQSQQPQTTVVDSRCHAADDAQTPATSEPAMAEKTGEDEGAVSAETNTPARDDDDANAAADAGPAGEEVTSAPPKAVVDSSPPVFIQQSSGFVSFANGSPTRAQIRERRRTEWDSTRNIKLGVPSKREIHNVILQPRRLNVNASDSRVYVTQPRATAAQRENLLTAPAYSIPRSNALQGTHAVPFVPRQQTMVLGYAHPPIPQASFPRNGVAPSFHAPGRAFTRR
jgi:hypothetical protein